MASHKLLFCEKILALGFDVVLFIEPGGTVFLNPEGWYSDQKTARCDECELLLYEASH